MDVQNWAENIKSESLSEQVLYRIQSAILSGRIKPGDFLPSEREMAEQFGVGKSSVREAVKMLQVLGILEPKPGKGPRVRESIGSNAMTPMLLQLILSNAPQADLYEFREMFEEAYTVVALRKIQDSDFDLLKEKLQACKACEQAGLPSLKEDFDFHLAVLNVTRNPYIIQVGTMLMQLFMNPLGRKLHENIRDLSMFTYPDHEEIYEALRSRDEARVRKCVRKLMDRYRNMLSLT